VVAAINISRVTHAIEGSESLAERAMLLPSLTALKMTPSAPTGMPGSLAHLKHRSNQEHGHVSAIRKLQAAMKERDSGGLLPPPNWKSKYTPRDQSSSAPQQTSPKPANLAPKPANVPVLPEGVFEVERILKVRMVGKGRREFFVKWVGYDDSENSWIELSNFGSGQWMVQEWDAQQEWDAKHLNKVDVRLRGVNRGNVNRASSRASW